MLNPRRYMKPIPAYQPVDVPTPKPKLTQFTLFPKLPTEIRHKIFKIALHNEHTGRRILQVTAMYGMKDPDFGLYRQFLPTSSLARINIEGVKSLYHNRIGMQLLGTNREAHAVYRQRFTNYLPTGKPNVGIHFEEKTIVLINNLIDEQYVRTAILGKHRLQRFFTDITRLAVRLQPKPEELLTIVLDAFENLTNVVGIETKYSSAPDSRRVWKAFFEEFSLRRAINCEIIEYQYLQKPASDAY